MHCISPVFFTVYDKSICQKFFVLTANEFCISHVTFSYQLHELPYPQNEQRTLEPADVHEV